MVGRVTCGHFYINKSVCLNSMSFTANIVNIHRTIIHVLAFQKGATFWFFFFTSLEHHKMRRKERKKNLTGYEGEMNIKLLFEVQFSSV